MSTTTTIAFLHENGDVVCPPCHAEDPSPGATQRLCRRDVEPGTECSACGETIVADPDDVVRERPDAWDEGGKEMWKEMRS